MWEESRGLLVSLNLKMLFFSKISFLLGEGVTIFYNSKSELPHSAMGISARQTGEAMGLES